MEQGTQTPSGDRTPDPAAGLPPANGSPTIPLGELVHQYSLGLVLIAGASSDAAERRVQWVHVSELEDPTPFLPPRTVLLTTGARFSALSTQTAADAYVARLIEAGTTALGVAVGLHWDRVPPRFVSACDRLGLPLFRVPYGTAFIEIVQTAARLLSARERDRDLWVLEAQRAVTAASLHGLEAAVREAAHRLGRWACITDRSGRIVEFAPQAFRGWASPDWIRREARRLVERGLGAGRIGADDEAPGVQMFALGRQGRVLGVLAVEDRGTPDSAERTLLAHVAALATVQLEHRAGIGAAQASLRAAILRLLLEGQVELAEQLASGTIERVPREPVVVVRYPEAERRSSGFTEDLQSLDAGSPGILSTVLDGAPALMAEARHVPAIRRLLLVHRVPSGISERGTLARLPELLDQADRALDFARHADAEAPVDYLPALHDGVLHLLGEHPAARARAEGLLAPIRGHDERHGDSIEESLAAWLAHHGQTSAAAAALGVHRHTLRGRVETAAQLLQADLDSPDTRAELWAALRLTQA